MELERRFLLADVPPNVFRPIRITDRYIRETNLRLRRMDDLEGSSSPLFKLAQKVRPDPKDPTRIALTNLYITAFEYELLAVHPADVLAKIHYSLRVDDRHVIVNTFEGDLQGLILLEADFGSEDEMATFSPPYFVVREVSHDDRFSGGRLATANRDEIAGLLKR